MCVTRTAKKKKKEHVINQHTRSNMAAKNTLITERQLASDMQKNAPDRPLKHLITERKQATQKNARDGHCLRRGCGPEKAWKG